MCPSTNASSRWRISLARGDGSGNMVGSLLANLDGAAEGCFPIEDSVVGNHAVEVGGDGWREWSCAARGHIDVSGKELAGGREDIVVTLGHEMHDMELLLGALEQSAAKRNVLAGANLLLVAEELSQGKAAKPAVLKVGPIHAQKIEEAAGCPAKEMRVPHHVHVPHHVEV